MPNYYIYHLDESLPVVAMHSTHYYRKVNKRKLCRELGRTVVINKTHNVPAITRCESNYSRVEVSYYDFTKNCWYNRSRVVPDYSIKKTKITLQDLEDIKLRVHITRELMED